MEFEERKQIFWLLKKLNSYTTWLAFAQSWERFVDAWKYGLVNAGSDSIFYNFYKIFIKGERAFGKALPLLKSGDKSVFAYSSGGYFRTVYESYVDAVKVVDPVEYVFDWAVNKDEIFSTFDAMMKQCKHVGPLVLGDTAPMRAGDVLKFYALALTSETFPDIPEPTDITIATGGVITFDGIWEPEWATFRGVRKGCMNYLLEGGPAPHYHDTQKETPFPVIWRLVWEDTRYIDGAIPEEEEAYLSVPKDSYDAK